MLERVLRHINNWFLVPGGFHSGKFTVQNGKLELPFLQTSQYFRVVGSVFNDGLYQYPVAGLKNETFEGSVWALAIPREIIELSDRIDTWEEKNSEAVMSPYQSESFGGYSYTKASDSTGAGATWQSVFCKELNRWRKL